MTYALFVLGSAGAMVFALQRHLVEGMDGLLLSMALTVVYLALFLVGYILRERRKAVLLDTVMPLDRGGCRRLNHDSYTLLTAEHRAIGEAEFRKELAKAMKDLR